MKINRKSLIRLNDKLCSEYVRSKYEKCLFKDTAADIKNCTGNPENAFHFIGRRHHILRWDVITPNVVASCWPHNAKYSGRWGGSDQAAYWEVYLNKFGRESWKKLIERRRETAHYGIAELERINYNLLELINSKKNLCNHVINPQYKYADEIE